MRGGRIPFGPRWVRGTHATPFRPGCLPCSRVTRCHGNRGLIVFHRFASRNAAARRDVPRRERKREGEREARCLAGGIQMRLRSTRLAPEIQTYLLRTAASPIIMRREFNLPGPIVNTARLDSRFARPTVPQPEGKSQVRNREYPVSIAGKRNYGCWVKEQEVALIRAISLLWERGGTRTTSFKATRQNAGSIRNSFAWNREVN